MMMINEKIWYKNSNEKGSGFFIINPLISGSVVISPHHSIYGIVYKSVYFKIRNPNIEIPNGSASSPS
jgi:hypothetical protein